MALFDFLVGDWVGISTTYQGDSSIQIPAFESISYRVDAEETVKYLLPKRKGK